MTQTTSQTGSERLANGLTAGIERSLEEPAADGSKAAAELIDVVGEIDDLLETIDFERLPDAIDASALPDLIESDRIPDAIRERNPDLALDFGSIRRVIVLRELWNAVDLVGFQRELRHLKRELEDVVGPDAFGSSGDSEAAAEIRNFVAEVKPDATNAALQQEAKKGAKTARKGVIDGHSKFEELYESTQRGSGYAGRRPVSKNPTAVSSVPYGPLPAGVSTRVSTVPANVRHAKVDALPRIYGRRWRSVADRP
ncbi:hypothetical protein [Natrinema sp. 1APR25-10V2]|uniref:hypothetical protein n=1 Tax=Natrinema sp. 1APR25-10V2 TaxID=2951081 RepID=UPI0028770DBF|nr:hypothetical protein [Natrinema sp. 1APR25-10V2]MDS0475179.1 hypothetical protein [Natrinema sp. 1APR25-10V2]